MATILDASKNQLKLNNGSVVTANTGGWYDGQHYFGGTLSDKGVINSKSGWQGAGQKVSSEVNTASAITQGVSPQNFNEYLSGVSAKDITSPAIPAYTSGNTGSTSYVDGLNQTVAQTRQALDQNILDQRATTQADLATAKAKEASAMGEVQKLTTPFRASLETSERAKYGTEGVLSEQKSLLSELDQLLTEGNTLIKQQQETTGLSAIRNPRIQKTMDDVTARAGVINAVVSLQNTYLSNAYNAIDRSVSAITQDRKDQLSYYETVLNLANRDIVSLTAEDKRLAKEQTDILKSDLGRAQETSDYIKKMMINPDTAMLMARAGVSLNDTVEQINAKLETATYASEVRTVSNEMAKSGYSVVVNPNSVPANRLITITDSRGNKYYYQKAITGDSSSFDSSAFMKKLTEMGYKVEGEGTKTPANVIDTSSIWNEVLSGSNETYAGKPNFIPAGGAGTPWKDSSGKDWTFSTQGWIPETTNLGIGAN